MVGEGSLLAQPGRLPVPRLLCSLSIVGGRSCRLIRRRPVEKSARLQDHHGSLNGPALVWSTGGGLLVLWTGDSLGGSS
jgi:hypothetical protein